MVISQFKDYCFFISNTTFNADNELLKFCLEFSALFMLTSIIITNFTILFLIKIYFNCFDTLNLFYYHIILV